MTKEKKLKKIRYERNRLKKIMRSLRRKNKSTCARTKGTSIYIVDTSLILKEKNFFNKSISDYVIIKTDGAVKITIPKDFSIAKNANEVIYLLKKIFYCGMQPQIKEIVFDHSRCVNLGIAASTIMDAVVLAAKSYHKSIGGDLNVSGNYPYDKYTKDVFIGSGLVKHLNLNIKEDIEKSKIITFKLASGKSETQNSSQIATKLTNYFNDCLKTQQYCLTESGENSLAAMFGEIIDNCEKHGGNRSVWYVLGHYQIRDEFEYGEIQLTMFDFGDSIYERLCSAETTNETNLKLESMKKIHERYFSKNWTKETLYTVFSLQEGISRLRDKDRVGFRNRGKGTITLMDTFYRLGHTKDGKEPELVIVSGNTHIKFDEKYKPEYKELNDEIFGNKPRKIIAFNKENDIYKPAEGNVNILDEYFPGTAISMKFYLDKEFLDSKIKEK